MDVTDMGSRTTTLIRKLLFSIFLQIFTKVQRVQE